jgi:hypothetical protein
VVRVGGRGLTLSGYARNVYGADDDKVKMCL